jgi:hypothetical protein
MVEAGKCGSSPHEMHDPEKWEPVFPRDKREAFALKIMLKQRDEILIRADDDLK